MDEPLMIGLGMAVLAAAAVALSVLLRAARCPGAAIVGGVLAGILLGPTVFGRAFPVTHGELFLGAMKEQRDLAVQMALPGASADSVAEKQAALRAARWEAQRPVRAVAAALIFLTLLASAAGPRLQPDPRQGWLISLSIGLWASLLTGGLSFVLLYALLDYAPAPSLLASAALAIGPWMIAGVERRAADDAELGGAFMIRRAGRVMTALAIIATVVGGALLVREDATSGTSRLLWLLPLSGAPLAWLLRAGALSGGAGAVRLMELAGLPILAALAALRIELLEDITFWASLIFLLLSSDGRWVGAFLGAVVSSPRRGLPTMRLVMGVIACGPTQLALTALLAHLLPIDGELILALLLGVLVIEISRPTRRKALEMIYRTEDELAALTGDDQYHERRASDPRMASPCRAAESSCCSSSCSLPRR